MLARMPSRVFDAWLSFYQSHPFGEDIEERRAAMLASLIANALSSGSKRFAEEDFMLSGYGTKPKKAATVGEAFKAAILAQKKVSS
jgi:hypothetical protein